MLATVLTKRLLFATLAVAVIGSVSKADFDERVRQKAEQDHADSIAKDRADSVQRQAEDHAMLNDGAARFAARHHGFNEGPVCTYHPDRWMPDDDTAEYYPDLVATYVPDDCTILKFSTRDGLDCKLEDAFPRKNAVKVSCIDGRGKIGTSVVATARYQK